MRLRCDLGHSEMHGIRALSIIYLHPEYCTECSYDFPGQLLWVKAYNCVRILTSKSMLPSCMKCASYQKYLAAAKKSPIPKS